LPAESHDTIIFSGDITIVRASEPDSPLIFVTVHAPATPFDIERVAIQILDESPVDVQFDGLLVGLPGVATEENINSTELLSVRAVGAIHAVCCGVNPSEVKIRVDIHSLADPDGTPSVQPEVVGIGDEKDPPDGVPGVVFVRIKTVDLNIA
jgi:hypothetical protein